MYTESICTPAPYTVYSIGPGNRRRLEGNQRGLEGNRRRLEGNQRRLEGNRRRLESDFSPKRKNNLSWPSASTYAHEAVRTFVNSNKKKIRAVQSPAQH